jgi:AbrB family looped-hinge helix DNA binding protein
MKNRMRVRQSVVDKDSLLVKNKDMAKITSKLQVTIPKAVAEKLGIKPGDELDWQVAGDTMRVTPVSRTRHRLPAELRLKLFDQATARQRARNSKVAAVKSTAVRGWKREDLYERGRTR